MLKIQERFVVDEKGKKTTVVINIDDYIKIKRITEEFKEFDIEDVNEDIAKTLKEVEVGKTRPIENLFREL